MFANCCILHTDNQTTVIKRKGTNMNTQDKIQLIEDAQDLLRQALNNIEQALCDSPDTNYYQAYLVRNLGNMINGQDNPYDANLNSLIEALQAKN